MDQKLNYVTGITIDTIKSANDTIHLNSISHFFLNCPSDKTQNYVSIYESEKKIKIKKIQFCCILYNNEIVILLLAQHPNQYCYYKPQYSNKNPNSPLRSPSQTHRQQQQNPKMRRSDRISMVVGCA